VAALRVSAAGWEGFVLEGFMPILQRDRPPVIAVEWSPLAMRAAGWTDPLRLLRMLDALGYDDVSHSGYVCDQRWYAITYGVRRRGGATPDELAAFKQPTWCRLLPEDRQLLVERASSASPETLLFIRRGSKRPAAGEAADGAQGEKRVGGQGSVSSPRRGGSRKGVPDSAAAAGRQPEEEEDRSSLLPSWVDGHSTLHASNVAEAAALAGDPAANGTARAVEELGAEGRVSTGRSAASSAAEAAIEGSWSQACIIFPCPHWAVFLSDFLLSFQLCIDFSVTVLRFSHCFIVVDGSTVSFSKCFLSFITFLPYQKREIRTEPLMQRCAILL
jgi:hypothetical protein